MKLSTKTLVLLTLTLSNQGALAINSSTRNKEDDTNNIAVASSLPQANLLRRLTKSKKKGGKKCEFESNDNPLAPFSTIPSIDGGGCIPIGVINEYRLANGGIPGNADNSEILCLNVFGGVLVGVYNDPNGPPLRMVTTACCPPCDEILDLIDGEECFDANVNFINSSGRGNIGPAACGQIGYFAFRDENESGVCCPATGLFTFRNPF